MWSVVVVVVVVVIGVGRVGVGGGGGVGFGSVSQFFPPCGAAAQRGPWPPHSRRF